MDEVSTMAGSSRDAVNTLDCFSWRKRGSRSHHGTNEFRRGDAVGIRRGARIRTVLQPLYRVVRTAVALEHLARPAANRER